MDRLGERRDDLVQRRDQLRARLDLVREANQEKRNRAHQIALTVESMRSSLNSLEQSLERMGGQLRQFTQRRAELEASIDGSEQPIQEQQAQLQIQLERRVEVEQELGEVRRSLEEIDAALRGREQARLQAEERVQEIRTELDQHRMQRQEVLVRAKTFEERLRESGFEVSALFQEMPEDESFNALGDLAICAAVVNREAEEQQKSANAHWAHMIIHGTLHLLGFDHQENQEAKNMEALETRVLAELGFGNPYE